MKNKEVVLILIGVLLIGIASAGFWDFFSGKITGNVIAEGSYEDTILKLSSPTNAHAENASGTAYSVKVNYSGIFGGVYTGDNPHVCAPGDSNLVLRLSSPTNAHAEDPALSNYDTKVCYGDLSCRYTAQSCIPPEKEVITLSDRTNAHLALVTGSLYQSHRICCNSSGGVAPVVPECSVDADCGPLKKCVNGKCENIEITVCNPDGTCPSGMFCNLENNCVERQAYWARDLSGATKITTIQVFPGETKLYLVLISNETQEFDIDIKRKRPLWTDEEITSFLDKKLENNKLILEWVFPVGGEGGNYYFKTSGLTNELESGDLTIGINKISIQESCAVKANSQGGQGINLCSHYINKEDCAADECKVANNSIGSIRCGTRFTNSEGVIISYENCSCSWNSTINKCNANYSVKGDGTQIGPPNPGSLNLPLIIGTCDEEKVGGGDDCDDDGFLTYSWKGVFKWDLNNKNITPLTDKTKWKQTEGNVWRYNPDNEYEKCVNDAEQKVTVSCPSHIRLNFFSLINILAVVLILTIIYFILIKKKIIKKK